MDARAALGAAMRAFHEQWDLLVLPTMKLTAFAVGLNAPLGADGQPDYGWNVLCYQFNLTSQPAASIPCGLTSAGLPVGLQVVGPMHDDLGVLAACAAYERARGPLPLPPR
jgi:aspartyl-tRNA(Asn)/glutamyl-tRNA(Gln) amidotransferase subunit A